MFNPKLKYIFNLEFGKETTVDEMKDVLKSQQYDFKLDLYRREYQFNLYLMTINNEKESI